MLTEESCASHLDSKGSVPTPLRANFGGVILLSAREAWSKLAINNTSTSQYIVTQHSEKIKQCYLILVVILFFR